MARIFIDPHMFSEDWFKDIIPELLEAKKVQFVYANCLKANVELSKVRQALLFQKRVMGLKDKAGQSRGCLVSNEQLAPHLEFIEGHDVFDGCGDCDDPHVFALVYVLPTQYIFSMDLRMAGCRAVMNEHIDRRYCSFIVVSRDQVYQQHRQRIIS